MDASQYKVHVPVLRIIKDIDDKYASQAFAPIIAPKGASFADMVALKGKTDIGDQSAVLDGVRIPVMFKITAHRIAVEVEREKTAGGRRRGTRPGPERNFRVYLSVTLNKILRRQLRHVIEVT